jgi:membrane-associated phospholipid phosphatase
MYLLSSIDDDMHTHAKSLYTGNWKTYFNTIDHLGNVPYTAPVSIGLTGLTLLGNDKKLQDAAFTSTQALITSMVFVGIGKIIIGRTRPDADFGPREFKPFTDFDASFPSGHTAGAFALVVPWIYYYPHPLTYALLVLPASTAISRMVLDRHWFTDILTGAVLGSLVGYTLAKWHNELADTNGFYEPEKALPKMIAFTVRF